MLVIPVGAASESDAERYFVNTVPAYLPLLQLCQLAYGLKHEEHLMILRSHDPLVDVFASGIDSLVAIPDVALGIDTTTGDSSIWKRHFTTYERMRGSNYDPKRFLAIWRRIALPLVNARNKGIPPKLMSIVERTTKYVSGCLHRSQTELALRCVVGTESLLNPFGQSDGISERLALYGAALFTRNKSKRIQSYARLKKLYGYRSAVVHSARLEDAPNEEEIRFAFDVYAGCLRKVITWALRQRHKNAPVDNETFKRFLLDSLYGT